VGRCYESFTVSRITLINGAVSVTRKCDVLSMRPSLLNDLGLSGRRRFESREEDRPVMDRCSGRSDVMEIEKTVDKLDQLGKIVLITEEERKKRVER
jgi:hypothetical protein